MTPEERKVLEDAENEVQDIIQQQQQAETSGRRPEPLIEGTESSLDGQTFGLDFGGEPFAASTGPGAGTPPPATCFATAVITLSDLTIDCGCIAFSAGSVNSEQYFEQDDPNSTYSLTLDTEPTGCPGPATCDESFCYADGPSETYVFDAKDYTDGACSSLFVDDSGNIVARLVNFGGTWFIALFGFGIGGIGKVMLFYAEVATLVGSIANQIGCTDAQDISLDNAFTDLAFGGPEVFTGIAQNGSVTVVLS